MIIRILIGFGIVALTGLVGVIGLYVRAAGDYQVLPTVADDPDLPRVELNGHLFHAETHGNPAHPTVIVLHGGPGGDYRTLLALTGLADRHHIVFYDQRGAGLSARTTADHLTPTTALEDLDAFFRCGWGFNGHTQIYNYIITAGHCPGGVHDETKRTVADDEIRISHPASGTTRILTSNPFVYSNNDADYDVARISSAYADDNCFHGASYACEWRMDKRAWWNSQDPGQDRTCISLARTNRYTCGYITELNVSEDDMDGLMKVDFAVQTGDSGSGAKWGNTIDGILVKRDLGDNNTGLIQGAYEVKIGLGSNFDFNCGVGRTTNGAPYYWDPCPGYSR